MKAVEAMFSSVCDLASDDQELLLRVHPDRRAAWEAIGDVEMHLNSEQGIVVRNYSDIAATKIDRIVRATAIPGFDQQGDPLIYELADGTVRIVFLALPPVEFLKDREFDMDEFGGGLIQQIGGGIQWDDREVFYIPNPPADCVDSIVDYVTRYGA